MSEIISDIPCGILVDIVEVTDGSNACNISAQPVDLGVLLKSYSKVVLFAVPGASTPTCSAKHLPGFIEHADAIRSKGVDAIFCVSVNDKFVMQAWGNATNGFTQSKIKLVADGNGDFTKAIGQLKDFSAYRMGSRSSRYAAIIENGEIKNFFVDEAGLEKSSAEHILSLL